MASSKRKDSREIVFKLGLLAVTLRARRHLRKAVAVVYGAELSGEYVIARR
jgi:hypothetical protein